MTEVNEFEIGEAQKKLYQLVRRAEAGETIILMRDGAPVIDIVPTTKRVSSQHDL